MSKEITLTCVPVATEAVFRSVLDEFEARTHIHVNLQMVEWEQERADIVGTALRRQEGDVLLVGMPVTSDLIGMNALRPFTLQEIAMLGGQAAYLPSRWQSGMRPGSAQSWAVPLLVDVRLIFYRRSLLEAAGLDECCAFDTSTQLHETLRLLQAAGMAHPLVVPHMRYIVLHLVSSWIWAEGGDLFTPDGRKVAFHQEKALRGMRAYFNLMRYAHPNTPSFNDRSLVMDGSAAVVISGGWIAVGGLPPEISAVPLPGGSYVGGSDLAIWAHTRSEDASMELVRYLSQHDAQARILADGFQSPRLSELAGEVSQSDSVRSAFARAALTGRTYPCVPMIGMVEDRLSTAISQIQQKLLDHPELNAEDLLQSIIVPLGKRINLAFS